jgi:catechol 2,3-dioxygenase-like lactoylglutathione lyase family enzyme
MSRVQLALRVADLEGSIDFYRSLFGVEPAKRRHGYANFALTEPPLKLVLIEGQADEPTVLDHLGVEVDTSDEVHAATDRLSELACSPRSRTPPPAATPCRTRCGSTVPATSRGRSTR